MSVASDVGYWINSWWPWQLTDELGVSTPPIQAPVAAGTPPQPVPIVTRLEQLKDAVIQTGTGKAVAVVAVVAGVAIGLYIMRKK